MNDSKEQRHAVEFMERVIGAKLNQETARTAEERFFETSMSIIDLHDVCKEYQPIWTASFTEEGDLLSQWRAYCNRSGGYCLGFPSNFLKNLADEQDYILAPCLYEFNDVKSVVEEIYDFAFRTFRDYVITGRSAEECWTLSRDMLAKYLAFYGTFIKHWSFREEKEWRIVSASTKINHDALQFIEGEHGVRVFEKFKLSTDLNPIVSGSAYQRVTLKVGPNARIEAANLPAKLIMEELVGVGNANNGASDTTYQ